MSLTILNDLQDELLHLMLSGSNLLGDDFKLSKMLRDLEELGKRTPAFAKVSSLLGEMLKSEPDQTAQLLLKALTLVNSILLTQAQTGKVGELTEPALLKLDQESIREVNFKAIDEIREMLLKDSHKDMKNVVYDSQGKFNGEIHDIRLFRPLLKHLQYGGNSAFWYVEGSLLAYGETILPLIIKNYSPYSNSRNEYRKFRIIIQLIKDSDKIKELSLEALKGENHRLQIEALCTLKDDPECLEIFLEYSEHKDKNLKKTALEILLSYEDEAVEEVILNSFLAQEPVLDFYKTKEIKSERFFIKLLTKADEILQEMKVSGISQRKLETLNNSLSNLIMILKGKKNQAIFQFYGKVFQYYQETEVLVLELWYTPPYLIVMNLLKLEDFEGYELAITGIEQLGTDFQKMFKSNLYEYSAPLNIRWMKFLTEIKEYHFIKNSIKAEDHECIEYLVARMHQIIAASPQWILSEITEILEILIESGYEDIWSEFELVFKYFRDSNEYFGSQERIAELINKLPEEPREQKERFVRDNTEYLTSKGYILSAD